MPPFALRAVGLLALFAVLGAAREASAFCRTGTCSLPANFNPSATVCVPPGNDTCAFNGTTIKNVPLWWLESCVGYSVQRDASQHVSLDDVTTAVGAAFGAWTTHSCPTDGTGTSKVTIDSRDLGPVECGEVGYYNDRPNQHVIVFRDQAWPHKTDDEIKNNVPSPTIALTTVSFDPSTGQIYDADIEINTADHKVILNPAPGAYDLESVLTHESGHFLGIAHSSDPAAVMYFQDEGGSAKHRDLTEDDINAVCTVYPPGGLRPVDTQVDPSGVMAAGPCDPTPRHGLSSDCAAAPAPSPSSGCALGYAQGGLRDGAVGTLFGLVLVGIVRRRSRRRGT